jgi:hypothetical protein
MEIEEQLTRIKQVYPEAWSYFQQQIELSREQGREEGRREAHESTLPKFDDNDEVIHYWGGTLSAKEDKHD